MTNATAFTTVFTSDELVNLKDTLSQAHASVKSRALSACNDLAGLLESKYLTEDEKEFIRDQIAFVKRW